MVGAALLLAWGPTPSVHAATITVDPAGAGTGVSADGYCSLKEAIFNANDDAATHADCDAGYGADTIVLSGGTYTYITPTTADTALPQISTDITFNANGATIERDSSAAANFRLIRVNGAGTLTLNDAIIAGGRGYGGIQNRGTLTINNSTISGNSAEYQKGGGISNRANVVDATLTINNSAIADNGVYNNFAAYQGGGIANYSISAQNAVVTINNSTISGNDAGGLGGGLANWATSSGSAQATVNDSTITLNKTEYGFGSYPGGGVYNGASNSTVALNRSIVSGNTSRVGDGEEIYDRVAGAGGVTANNYNLFGHSLYSSGESFIGFTPSGSDIIGTSDGGTPHVFYNIMKKGLRDRGTLSHSLVSGSPAIDAVPLSDPSCTAGDDDQHGGDRANGAGAGGAACDIGAVEYDSNTGVNIPVTVGAAGINNGDGCSLVEAVTNANDDRATYAECAAGEADDTITLAGNSYAYTARFGTLSALPDITSDLTIEGNGATIERTGGASFGILFVLENGDLTLNETTVTGGTRSGIYSLSGGITLNDSAVTNNSNANIPGGGIYITGNMKVGKDSITPEWGSTGELNLNNTTISGNTSFESGGGIRANFVHMRLNNVTIANNQVPNDYYNGGGVAIYGVFGEINNTTISGNTAGTGGGLSTLVYSANVPGWPGNMLTLNHVTVTGNSATNPSGIPLFRSDIGTGGGIHLIVGILNINNSILSGNTGAEGGGQDFNLE